MEAMVTAAERAAQQCPNIFFEIGKTLTSSLELKEIFSQVMKIIGEHFHPQHWSLLLMDEETERLRFEIVVGVDPDRLKGFWLERGEGIAGWVSLHGTPLVVDDVRTEPRFSQRVDQFLDFTTRSVVCVPLLTGKNRVVGVIELVNKIKPQGEPLSSRAEASSAGEAFTEVDMLFLSSIGVFTGIAVENAFLYQKVRDLAMIDSLTGIYNRHYFNEIFQREIERVSRYGHSICVLMMDVDGLKAINDTHGHLVGDRVLAAVANILKNSVRKSDTVARFGGDEFVILMPNTDEAKGRALEKRIRQLIDQWNEKPIAPGVRMGLSFGIHAAGPDTVGNILLGADQALYRTKNFREKPEEITAEDRLRHYVWDIMTREGDGHGTL